MDRSRLLRTCTVPNFRCATLSLVEETVHINGRLPAIGLPCGCRTPASQSFDHHGFGRQIAIAISRPWRLAGNSGLLLSTIYEACGWDESMGDRMHPRRVCRQMPLPV